MTIFSVFGFSLGLVWACEGFLEPEVVGIYIGLGYPFGKVCFVGVAVEAIFLIPLPGMCGLGFAFKQLQRRFRGT